MWSNMRQRNFLSEPWVMIAMHCCQTALQIRLAKYRTARMAALAKTCGWALAQSPLSQYCPTTVRARSMKTLGMAWTTHCTRMHAATAGSITG